MSIARAYLPRIDPPPLTLLDYLAERFAHVSRATWRERFAGGRITLQGGAALREDSPYRPGVTVLYPKEVIDEPEVLEDAAIVYQDEQILVADKPHGMPVTPVGEWIERSLLVHLQKRTGIPTLAPMHRLDRDTAGLVLFCIRSERRGVYHALFAKNRIRREYVALAHADSGRLEGGPWRVENRIEAGQPWFRQRIVEGPPNAVTKVEYRDRRPDEDLSPSTFLLIPETGKKHQLRVHMASLGFPIVGDSLYGNPTTNTPLQLLARKLTFTDPLRGSLLEFTSGWSLPVSSPRIPAPGPR